MPNRLNCFEVDEDFDSKKNTLNENLDKSNEDTKNTKGGNMNDGEAAAGGGADAKPSKQHQRQKSQASSITQTPKRLLSWRQTQPLSLQIHSRSKSSGSASIPQLKSNPSSPPSTTTSPNSATAYDKQPRSVDVLEAGKAARQLFFRIGGGDGTSNSPNSPHPVTLQRSVDIFDAANAARWTRGDMIQPGDTLVLPVFEETPQEITNSDLNRSCSLSTGTTAIDGSIVPPRGASLEATTITTTVVSDEGSPHKEVVRMPALILKQRHTSTDSTVLKTQEEVKKALAAAAEVSLDAIEIVNRSADDNWPLRDPSPIESLSTSSMAECTTHGSPHIHKPQGGFAVRWEENWPVPPVVFEEPLADVLDKFPNVCYDIQPDPFGVTDKNYNYNSRSGSSEGSYYTNYHYNYSTKSNTPVVSKSVMRGSAQIIPLIQNEDPEEKILGKQDNSSDESRRREHDLIEVSTFEELIRRTTKMAADAPSPQPNKQLASQPQHVAQHIVSN